MRSGEQIALVAQLPRVAQNDVEIRWGGLSTDFKTAVSADGEFPRITFGPLTEPGLNVVSVTDLRGTELASGLLTVTVP
ncbi:MAG TPA: hypothetical protein VF494_09270 [Candidatus Limnocylindrales bacterium]